MKTDLDDGWQSAHHWTSFYNKMPGSGGVRDELRFGVAEENYAALARFVNGSDQAWLLSDHAAMEQVLRKALWDLLCCGNAPPGVSFLVYDLGYRVSPRIVRNWCKLLVGELPDEPLTANSWSDVQQRYEPDAVINYLSDGYIRRVRSTVGWAENKQWWLNRNTQAVRRARKLVLEARLK